MIPKVIPDREGDFMEKEATMEEIVRIMKESQRDFIIHVEFGEEADRYAKEEAVQT